MAYMGGKNNCVRTFTVWHLRIVALTHSHLLLNSQKLHQTEMESDCYGIGKNDY